ncbi:MAG: trehalose-phosphatase [Deltaproteobacteria bacterium]|nr:trehalose-phosphatase [Deltaproteobacteria bacterium]
MIPLLGRDAAPLLHALAGSSSLLAFDYDGTLAPLVENRRLAALRPRTCSLLARVCDLYPCAVISGRSRADVARRLAGTGIKHIIGNHGLEELERSPRTSPAVRRARVLLRNSLRGAPGIDLEDKGTTLAVHYRHAPDRARARAAVLSLLEPLLPSLRVVGGHQVINVLPAGLKDKGTALAALWDRLGGDVALYVGDDLTDEPAFRLAGVRPLISVHVGARAESSAGYCLRGQWQVDPLLTRLVNLRRGRTPGLRGDPLSGIHAPSV